MDQATIAEPPWTFESRLITLKIEGLSRLTVMVPEAHDLVLLKVARGEAHDLDAIEDIHRASLLEVETLVERYLETVSQVVGSKRMHHLNFLAAVSRLFGDDVAAQVELQTKSAAK